MYLARVCCAIASSCAIFVAGCGSSARLCVEWPHEAVSALQSEYMEGSADSVVQCLYAMATEMEDTWSAAVSPHLSSMADGKVVVLHPVTMEWAEPIRSRSVSSTTGKPVGLLGRVEVMAREDGGRVAFRVISSSYSVVMPASRGSGERLVAVPSNGELEQAVYAYVASCLSDQAPELPQRMRIEDAVRACEE